MVARLPASLRSRRSRRLIGLVSLGSSVALGGILAMVACSQTPETNYGNPAGLRRENIPGEGGIEKLICKGTPGSDGGGGGGGGGEAGAGCGVSWSADIFPKMKPDGAWKCADPKCHGGVQAPVINATTAATAYDSLKDWKIPNSTFPYINTAPGEGGVGGDPDKSTIECNLLSQCGQGMPTSTAGVVPVKPSNDEMCTIDAWLRCGAPNN